MTTTMRVTWGERLRIEVERWLKQTGCKWLDLVKACASVEPAARNTYRKLLWLEDEPTGADARRAHVLALAIGLDPAKLDIKVKRLATWPDDEGLRELLSQRAPWTLESADQAA